eukprot:scaffold172776_cov15-Tisochrysis_lutea.AAC.2
MLRAVQGFHTRCFFSCTISHVRVKVVFDLPIQHNNKFVFNISELMDVLLACMDKSKGDHPNSLAEGATLEMTCKGSTGSAPFNLKDHTLLVQVVFSFEGVLRHISPVGVLAYLNVHADIFCKYLGASLSRRHLLMYVNNRIFMCANNHCIQQSLHVYAAWILIEVEKGLEKYPWGWLASVPPQYPPEVRQVLLRSRNNSLKYDYSQPDYEEQKAKRQNFFTFF